MKPNLPYSKQARNECAGAQRETVRALSSRRSLKSREHTLMRTMTRKAVVQLCVGLAGLPLVSAGVASHARASSAYDESRKPLPCNELCRAWLGSYFVEDRTDPVVELPRTADTNSTLPDRPVSSSVLKRRAVQTKAKQAEPLPLAVPMKASVDEGSTQKPALRRPRPPATRLLASAPLPVPRPMLVDGPVIAALPPRSAQVVSRDLPKEARPLDRTATTLTDDDHVASVAPNTVTMPAPASIGDIGRDDRARPSDAPGEVQVADGSPESIAAQTELEASYAVARQHLMNTRLVLAALRGKLFPLIHPDLTFATRPAIKDSTNGDAVAPLD